MPSRKAPDSIDVEEVVTEWAWKQFDRTATSKQKKLREKNKKNPKYINMNINWGKVLFRDETLWERLATDEMESANGQSNHTNNAVTNPNAALKSDGGAPHTNILFNTKFTNNTDDHQEYTMKTEKTTTSVCETAIETCFTKGIEFGVQLTTPGEIFEANAGYKRELSLTKYQGQTLEEQVNWGVESKITVKPQHVAEAQLVVNEKKYSGDFIIRSQIQGKVFITFTNPKDNNAMMKAITYDIAKIIKTYLQDTGRAEGKIYEKTEDSSVVLLTRGTCKFRYGINQEVKVSQVQLPKLAPK